MEIFYQDELSHKGQPDTTDKTAKRQRNELVNDQPRLPMKIISLNDDCLMKIFNYLNLRNLFNVGIGNEWLRPAAACVYKQKFGAKRAIIHECDDICHFMYPAPVESSNRIDIYGLKMCLRYLRCFGPSIRDISIDYNKSQSKRYQHVHDYLSKYCMESLVDVSFCWLLENSIPRFEKPLNSVTSITVQDSDLGKQLLSFAESCPNVCNLVLYDVCLDRNFNAASFKQLQHLTICAAFCSSRSVLITAYTELLHKNSQLESIELETSYIGGMETWVQMIKNNKAITKLIVTSRSIQCLVYLSQVQRLVNEHPSFIELDLRRYDFTVDNAVAMIQQLSALKKV